MTRKPLDAHAKPPASIKATYKKYQKLTDWPTGGEDDAHAKSILDFEHLTDGHRQRLSLARTISVEELSLAARRLGVGKGGGGCHHVAVWEHDALPGAI